MTPRVLFLSLCALLALSGCRDRNAGQGEASPEVAAVPAPAPASSSSPLTRRDETSGAAQAGGGGESAVPSQPAPSQTVPSQTVPLEPPTPAAPLRPPPPKVVPRARAVEKAAPIQRPEPVQRPEPAQESAPVAPAPPRPASANPTHPAPARPVPVAPPPAEPAPRPVPIKPAPIKPAPIKPAPIKPAPDKPVLAARARVKRPAPAEPQAAAPPPAESASPPAPAAPPAAEPTPAQPAPVQTAPAQPAPQEAIPAAPASLPVLPERPSAGQLRGLWVDAFGPGFKTPQEVSALVEGAAGMHFNAIFAQVGKRGDCYCNNASMPRTDDPAVPPGFDPLADLLEKAHAAGLQVHAWIITTAVVNVPDNPAPSQPDHVFNTHGPGSADDWMMRDVNGNARAGNDYLLDPGNPEAAAYIAGMYESVVRNYDVDGVQLDRVRYPDVSGGLPIWGYNARALARFRVESGETGTPAPSDPVWTAWRRQQVSDLVRRVYLGVKAIRPNVWVDVAAITYGAGPRTLTGFQASRTYAEVLQDWPGWLRAGYVDLNVLMNYKRDDNPDQARWYGQWNAFAMRERSLARVAAGSAMYLNRPAGSVRQAGAALANLDGWVGYSYRTPSPAVDAGTETAAQAWAALAPELSGAGGPLSETAEWGRPAAARLRAVSGVVNSPDGPVGGRAVTLSVNGRPFARTQTDGGGLYGFAVTPPGAFQIAVDGADPLTSDPEPGQVTELPDFQVP